MPRPLRRLARFLLATLPVQTVARALAGRLTRGLAVVVLFDCEPDDRRLDRADPGPWPSFEEVLRRAEPLRRRLAALSGQPAAFSWFVRMDPQIAEVWGSAGWAGDRYAAELAAVERAGDDVGAHTHVWRWDPDAREWLIDFDPDWGVHCLTVGLDAFEATLGRPCLAHHTGDRALNGAMLALEAERGIRVDMTIEPDLARHEIVLEGERSTGPLPRFAGVPRKPYRSSPSAYPQPDRERPVGPVLIPLTGVARGGTWERALLLGTPPGLFAVRMLVEILRRRPPVVAWVLRTDPDHLGAWDVVTENLEHLARHRGARFVAATGAVPGIRPGGSPAGPRSARSSAARSRQAAAS